MHKENNIIEKISNKQGIISENILEQILQIDEIYDLKNSITYILKKASEANYEKITSQTLKRDSGQIKIKNDNYNKDFELICITDEGKETREDVKILYSV
jgi:hypothetical protein